MSFTGGAGVPFSRGPCIQQGSYRLRMSTRGLLFPKAVSRFMGCMRRCDRVSGFRDDEIWASAQIFVELYRMIRMCFVRGSVNKGSQTSQPGRALGFELKMQSTLSCSQMVTKTFVSP